MSLNLRLYSLRVIVPLLGEWVTPSIYVSLMEVNFLQIPSQRSEVEVTRIERMGSLREDFTTATSQGY